MTPLDQGVAALSDTGRTMSTSARAWAGFQDGRDPYVTLVSIYVFMPYVATVLVGDAVKGQSLIAAYALIGGLVAALTAPFLGAAADRMGRRLPALTVLAALFAPLVLSLWWAKLWAFALPGKVHWAFVPNAPLFGLDPALGEPSRNAAPIAAVLFVLGFIPLLAFVQDAPRRTGSVLSAFAGGARDLVALVKSVRDHRDAASFFGARMLFSDAQIALIIFCGIYAAGVMHWGVLEMTAFGILMSTFAAPGGLLSSVFDRRFGPKRALQVEIIGTIVGITALLAVSPAGVRFVLAFALDAALLWNDPIFTKWPELIFLAIGGIVAVFNTAIFAFIPLSFVRCVSSRHRGQRSA